MNTIPLIFFSLLYGICISCLVFFIYNHIPESWLQEWDAIPCDPDYKKAKRLQLFSHLFLLFIPSFIACCLNLYGINTSDPRQIAYTAFLLCLYPVLCLLFISDLLNRILPHQFLITILVYSLGKTVIATFHNTDATGYRFSLLLFFQKTGIGILCGLFISALFFLPSVLMYRIKQTEIIGFGDIKMIFVCTLLCGIPGILFVLCTAFLLAGMTILISWVFQKKKTITIRSKIKSSGKSVHFSEDPAFIPLAPFFMVSVFIYLYIIRDIFILHANTLWYL